MSSIHKLIPITTRKSEGSQFHNYESQSLLKQLSRHESFPHPGKVVAIAKYSELRLFDNSRSSQFHKSYSFDDIELFRYQASFEASQVRDLISRYPLRTGNAFRHVMRLGLLTHEHLVGIEHLVCEKTAASVARERSSHVASVLKAQELIRKKYGNTFSIGPLKLARVANESSSKSVEKALIRAAMSWNAEDLNFSKLEDASIADRIETSERAKIRAAHAA